MELYKKIANIRNREDFFEIQEELEDRFGDLPKSVQMLLDIMLIKVEANALGITAISQKQGNLLLEFCPTPNIDPAKLMQLIAQEKGKYFFTAGAAPYLTVKPGRNEAGKPLPLITNILQALKA